MHCYRPHCGGRHGVSMHNYYNMLKYILVLGLILLLLSCSESNKQSYIISDEKNYSDFQVIYFESNDYFSSKDSVFRRRYIDSTTKIKCSLNIFEKKNILKSMEENDFLDLPDVLPENYNGRCQSPSNSIKIIAVFGKIQKSVLYEDHCDIKHKKQLKRFYKILSEIYTALYSKKEIKGLKQTDNLLR